MRGSSPDRPARAGPSPRAPSRRLSSAYTAPAAAPVPAATPRRPARDPEARKRRDAVLAVPRRLTGVGAAFDAASALIEAAEAEAEASVAETDATERAALEMALGAG